MSETAAVDQRVDDLSGRLSKIERWFWLGRLIFVFFGISGAGLTVWFYHLEKKVADVSTRVTSAEQQISTAEQQLTDLNGRKDAIFTEMKTKADGYAKQSVQNEVEKAQILKFGEVMNLPMTDLPQQYKCQTGDVEHGFLNCASAIMEYCAKHGFKGGFPQAQANASEVTIMCVK